MRRSVLFESMRSEHERLAGQRIERPAEHGRELSLHPYQTGVAMNEFEENKADTTERTVSERHIEAVRQQGGMFVEAVRRTRMPMLVTDATLPGNPIVFANQSFVDLSGYSMDDLLGQDPSVSHSSRSGWRRRVSRAAHSRRSESRTQHPRCSRSGPSTQHDGWSQPR